MRHHVAGFPWRIAGPRVEQIDRYLWTQSGTASEYGYLRGLRCDQRAQLGRVESPARAPLRPRYVNQANSKLDVRLATQRGASSRLTSTACPLAPAAPPRACGQKSRAGRPALY